MPGQVSSEGSVSSAHPHPFFFALLSHLATQTLRARNGKETSIRETLRFGRVQETRLLLFSLVTQSVWLIGWSLSEDTLHESPRIHGGHVPRPPVDA